MNYFKSLLTGIATAIIGMAAGIAGAIIAILILEVVVFMGAYANSGSPPEHGLFAIAEIPIQWLLVIAGIGFVPAFGWTVRKRIRSVGALRD